MPPSSSVLILDAGSRSREALTFGFEREDFRVLSTDRVDEADGLAQISTPQLLVVSIGQEPAARAEALSFIGGLRDGGELRDAAVVVLGRRDLREDALRAGADEFVSWPAFIRDAVTLSRLAIAARAEAGAGVSGLLEDYEVYFLVRALAAAGRSAHVELERAGHKGQIHFARGEVVAARVGRLSGVVAFHHLLLWAEATLKLRFVSPPGERKIQVPVEDLMQTGVRFVEEFEKLAKRVGGPQATFEKIPARFADPKLGGKVPPEVRRFAETVTSGATLVDLVESSPFKPFDTIKVCYRLCELGLIARRDPVRSISPLTAQLAVRDWLLGTAAPQQRSTVTEAGRRAAEAYAEAAARRAEQPPSEELFASAPLEAQPSAPQPVPDELPTAPREILRGPVARNKAKPAAAKAKHRGDKNADRAHVDRASVDSSGADKTAPQQKLPSPEAHARSAAHAKAHAKAAHAKREAPSAHAKSPVAAAKHAAAGAKLPREEIAHAPVKEPVFDELDEAFFANEAQLGKVEPVESFDDLDEAAGARGLSQKRKWSLFGAPPPAGKSPRKKR